MTISVEGPYIRLEGVLRVEDAEPLVVALQTSPGSQVDLSVCDDLHAAVLQALLIFRPTIVGLAENPALSAWLSPLLERNPPIPANS